MRYGSVCSGIEAASIAWEPLGMTPAWFSEIEAFPSAVLAHHWPDVKNLGDMTKISRRVLLGEIEAPDVLVGGTPCQAFSVAGMREGMADERGQLTMKYVELANAIDTVRVRAGNPETVIVWENVPGVLSDKSNAFGCFLGALAGEDRELQPSGKKWTNAGCVYGPQRTIAWRVLDAQYFGVAQRRRRVFVVASARADIDPAAVLFERESMRRDTPPSREKGKGFAADIAPCLSKPSGVSVTGNTRGHDLVATLDASYGRLQGCSGQDANHGHSHLLAVQGTQDPCVSDSTAFTLGRNNGGENAVYAFAQNSRDEVRLMDGDGGIVGALAAQPGMKQTCYVNEGLAVRRFTPVECERLQGLPDSHTAVTYRNKPAADGPRYKAIGNSMAVPCMAWIGSRLTALMGVRHAS